MACLRWNPVTATNSSRMRPFSARLPLLYRSMTAATSSSRVAMLTRLITAPPTPSGPGAFQVRQWLNIREHFWRGNAAVILIVALQHGVLHGLRPEGCDAPRLGGAGGGAGQRGAPHGSREGRS